MLHTEIFLDSIIENIPNMIFVKDAKELRFVRFNRAGEELLGYKREQMLGKNDFDFFPREQAEFFTARDREVLSSRKEQNIPEEPITTPHRGLRILHTRKIPIFDASGEPIYLLGISEDITEKKEAEEQKKRLLVEQAARQELIIEKDLREKFVAALSHDLRNPLCAAKSSAELLRRKPAKETYDRLVNKIVTSLDRTDRMVRDLLDTHLIRVGRMLHLTPTDCDLMAVVLDVLEELKIVYGERFTLECHGDRGSLNGFWNRDGLRRMIENLLSNGVKYGAADTPVTIRLKGGESVEIVVHNEGDPIPAQDQEMLFKPFHRLLAARQSGKHGWGLGLALVRGIAEAHGGEVRVESSTAGTDFIVKLPRDSRSIAAG